MAIDVWQIYFVSPCQYTRPEPKPKLVVIVCIASRPMGFLINTRIDPWIEIDPNNSVTQASILANVHSCLDYDSFVNCMELFAFDESELTVKRDCLSPNAKTAVKAAVSKSKTLVPKYKKLILKR